MARDTRVDDILVDKVFYNELEENHLKAHRQPSVIFITGVSGSGKSTFIDQIETNALKIQPDNYRKLHPKLTEFIRKVGRYDAHKKTGNYAFLFALALRNKAISNNINVIYEATFSKLETAENIIKPFRDAGYRMVIVTLPIDVDLSIQRNKDRYETKKLQDHTIPRLVSREDIENMANAYQNVISALQQQGITVISSTEFDLSAFHM